MRVSVAALVLTSGFVGCVPYTLGSTAQTVPEGQVTFSSTFSNALGADGRPEAAINGNSFNENVPGFDNEIRFGASDRSDIGIRLVHVTGLTATYKRRLIGSADYDEPALSLLVGGGVLSWGGYVSLESGILFSGREGPLGLPYGALRALATFPGGPKTDWDPPIYGAHLGWRTRLRFIRSEGVWLLPELAAYRDRSATGAERDWVFIPSVTISFGSADSSR